MIDRPQSSRSTNEPETGNFPELFRESDVLRMFLKPVVGLVVREHRFFDEPRTLPRFLVSVNAEVIDSCLEAPAFLAELGESPLHVINDRFRRSFRKGDDDYVSQSAGCQDDSP
jgi:hypothetical protein